MGMYTEIVLGANLKRDVPQQVLDVLAFMVGNTDQPPDELPDHALFRTPRWDYMLRCDSAYFGGTTHSSLIHDFSWELTVRSNLKNYEDEIEHFIDWVSPYIDALPGEFLGYWRYEEAADPTLIYAPGERQ